MTTAWANLPNAKHINRILADLKKYPKKWKAAHNTAWDAASRAAWVTTYEAVYDTAREAAWIAASNAASAAVRDAVFALIVWDDCAYLLDEKPKHVLMLGLLGNEKAILLYPASLALQKEIA